MEDGKDSKSTQRGRKDDKHGGCFVGVNPTDHRKVQAKELLADSEGINKLLVAGLFEGLVISLRADKRSGAYLCTLTRTAEDWRDNQTIGAYHVEPMVALCVALVYWDHEYGAVADWRQLTRQMAFDW